MWKKIFALTLSLGGIFCGYGIASNDGLDSPLKYQTIATSDVKIDADSPLDFKLRAPPNSETASPLVGHRQKYAMSKEGVVTAMREQRYTQSDQLVAEIFILEHGQEPISEIGVQMTPIDLTTVDALLQILGDDE